MKWIADEEERARLDKEREKGRRRSSVEKIKGVFGKGKGRVYTEEAEPVAQHADT